MINNDCFMFIDPQLMVKTEEGTNKNKEQSDHRASVSTDQWLLIRSEQNKLICFLLMKLSFINS